MMTRPLRAAVAGLAAIILSMALAAQPAFADDDSLAIFDATVDDGAGEITIGGQGFPDDPMVTFDGAAATIVGPTSETEIVIELPDGTPPAPTVSPSANGRTRPSASTTTPTASRWPLALSDLMAPRGRRATRVRSGPQGS